MTGGYDDWAAARASSLLVLATALVDDVAAAEAAVAQALRRVRSSWPRVSRDDPDLEARRHVVRACATPARAAYVLRTLEHRSDHEIAAVLRCSEAAARRHLRQAVGGTSGADTLAPRSAPARHLDVVRRRNRRRVGLGVVAAVAVALGVGYVVRDPGSPAGALSVLHPSAPADWRYESYAGVELQVPPSWGWGASPIRASAFDTPGHLGACGTADPTVWPAAGDDLTPTDGGGFVGRPAVVSARCVQWGADGTFPGGHAVWFASPLPTGEKRVGTTIAETRDVGDQHVTVFSGDPLLRRRILDSARQVDVDANGCPTTPVAAPTPGPSLPTPVSLSVCVYSQDTGVSRLLYSAQLPQPTARRYAAQVARGGTTRSSCPSLNGHWVALGLNGMDSTRWDVVNLGCDRIQLAGGRGAALTPSSVRSWAVDGVPAYVSQPPGDSSLGSYLRAPTQ
ncbi:MAG: hypothetical protein QM747_06140 [Nocardioides sp.]